MKTKDYFDKWSDTYGRVFGKEEYYLFLRWIFDTILTVLPEKNNAEILDLGTGGGRLMFVLHGKFKDAYFIGLDVSSGILKKAEAEAKKRGIKAGFINSKMSKIKLKDSTVDFAVSNFAVHHCKNKEKMLAEVFRVLKPGGYFVFGDIYEKFDKKHLENVEKLRKRNSRLAQEFDKSVKQAWDDLSDRTKKEHPKEYHLSPQKYLELMKKTGFAEVEVIRSINKGIVVIKAQK